MEDSSPDEGYIHVLVRARPLDARRGSDVGVTLNARSGEVNVESIGKQPRQTFQFAGTYQGAEDNEQVFEEVGIPLVQSALTGYNGLLMAYGQTGSGKTYTIGEIAKLSTPHEGVAHRMVRALFDEIESDPRCSYEVGLQFVQIYVERIYDLLADRSHDGARENAGLALREDKKSGVYVQGAQTEPVSSADDALQLMKRASSRLAFAATNMNMHSSRSHSICSLFVTKTPNADTSGAHPPMLSSPTKRQQSCGSLIKSWKRKSVSILENVAFSHSVTKGKLTLVDLAGSEDVGRSGATGTALAEAKKINTSLLALGNVIQALTTASKGRYVHVPFRDSSLTRLLQESFGGNCKTTMLCCISPAASDLVETISTLRFGGRAKQVRNNARINATVDMEATAHLNVAVNELAESLQRQLQTAEARLVTEQAKCHATTARALQMAFRFNNAKRQKEVETAKATAAEALAAKEARDAVETAQAAAAAAGAELEATRRQMETAAAAAQARALEAQAEAHDREKSELGRRAKEELAAAAARAARNLQESLDAEKARAAQALEESRVAAERRTKAAIESAVASARAVEQAQAQAAAEVAMAERSAAIAQLQEEVRSVRVEEQAKAAEQAGVLRSEMAVMRVTHESAMAASRAELRAAHDAAIEKDAQMDASVKQLQAAHTTALAKVKASHERIVAERERAASDANEGRWASLRQQLEQLQERAQSAMAEKAAADARAREVTETRRQTQAEDERAVAALVTERAEALSHVATLEARVTEAEGQHERTRSELVAASARVEALEALCSQQAARQKAQEEREAALAAELQSTRVQIDEMSSAAVEAMRLAVQKHQATVETMRADEDARRLLVSKATADAIERAAQETQLKAKASLATAMAEAQVDADSAREAVVVAAERREATLQTEMESRISALQLQLEELQLRAENAEEQRAAAEGRVTVLEGRVSAHESERQEMRRQLGVAAKQIDTLERRRQDQCDELSERQSASERLAAELDEANGRLAVNELQLVKFDDELTRVMQAWERTKAERDQLHHLCDDVLLLQDVWTNCRADMRMKPVPSPAPAINGIRRTL